MTFDPLGQFDRVSKYIVRIMTYFVGKTRNI